MSLDRRKLLAGMSAVLAGVVPCGRAPAQEPAPAGSGARPGSPPPIWEDKTLLDPATRRRIRLRLRLPIDHEARPAQRRPLIVYSPGLGGGLSNGAAWCEAWRRAGLVVATLAHPGTDDSLWHAPQRGLRAILADALAPEQYAHRVSDCRYAIRQCLTTLGLGSIVDPTRIGVAGHSFGALTVQALAAAAGRSHDGITIAAAIALSPGGRASAATLVGARMPFFCVTGDHDGYVTFGRGADAMRLGMPLADRLAVYRRLPRGAKQLLVLAGADHMTFAGEPVRPLPISRDVDTSDAATARAWSKVSLATTAFWQHYLGPSPRPDRNPYLDAVRSRLDPDDRLEAA